MSVRFGLSHRRPVVFSGDPVPTFQLNFADNGSGQVSLSEVFGANPTYTRAGVAQAELGDGTFAQVAANSARSWYSPGGIFLGGIFEGSRVNLCVRGNSFSADWSAVGTPTRTGGTTVLGTCQLDKLSDVDAGTLDGYSLPITFTGNATKAIAIAVKKGTSTSGVVRLRDGTASADRLLAVVTWSGTVPVVTMTTGSDILAGVQVQQGTSGAYILKFLTTSVTAANSHTLQVYPATDAALSVGNTGDMEFGVVNVEDATFPSSPIITTGATVTRNADVLSYAVGIPAASFSVLCYYYQNVFTSPARLYQYNNGDAGSFADTFISGSGNYQGLPAAGVAALTTAAATLHKVARRFQTDNHFISVDGSVATTMSTGTLATDQNKLQIGNSTGNSQFLFGAIQKLVAYPTALPNGVLQQLTT